MNQSKQVSFFWTKLQLRVIKILPILIATAYVLNTIFAFVGIGTMFLSLLGGMSLLPLLFLYLSSYAFRFCGYHRMFLHYVLASDILNWINFVFGIPVADITYLIVLVLLFGITCFIALYLFLKEKYPV